MSLGMFRKLETKYTENAKTNKNSIFVSFMKSLLYFKSPILKFTLNCFTYKIIQKIFYC